MIPAHVTRGMYLASLVSVHALGLLAEDGEVSMPALNFGGGVHADCRHGWDHERALIVGVLGFGAPVRRCLGAPVVGERGRERITVVAHWKTSTVIDGRLVAS